jgi:hypothetical protein
MDQDLHSIAISYTSNNGTQGTVNVAFYANGTRDNTTDFAGATALLNPTFQIIEDDSKEPIDIWAFINWYMTSAYWTFLYQFGDIAPTIYEQASAGQTSEIFLDGQLLINGMGYPNFSAPITSPPTNNIFWNETLFDIYTVYLRNTLLPLLLRIYPEFNNTFVLPPFLPLNDSNRAERVPTSIYTSYQCSEYVWKGWASALVSVLVSVFSLWTTGFAIMIWILMKLERDDPLILNTNCLGKRRIQKVEEWSRRTITKDLQPKMGHDIHSTPQ